MLFRRIARKNRPAVAKWTFCFDHAKRRFGNCKYSKRQIRMSRHFLQNPKITMKNVRNTMLHEVAHAIVGEGHGHDAAIANNTVAVCVCGGGDLDLQTLN